MGRRKESAMCGLTSQGAACCRVESLVSVDERGQMVLPKEIRERAGIGPGDKLALVTWEREGEICCIVLMKVDGLAEMVKGALGPVVREVFKGE